MAGLMVQSKPVIGREFRLVQFVAVQSSLHYAYQTGQSDQSLPCWAESSVPDSQYEE